MSAKQQSKQPCNTMEDVEQLIKGMKFKKKLFGGVDEADVWRQIELLHKAYEEVFVAQAARYQAAIESGSQTTLPRI